MARFEIESLADRDRDLKKIFSGEYLTENKEKVIAIGENGIEGRNETTYWTNIEDARKYINECLEMACKISNEYIKK